MIHSGFGGLVTTPITRREILILICMTLMFTLLLQFNMGSVSSWKIGSSRASDDQGSVIRKEEPLSLNDEWTDEQEVRFGHVVAEDPFMGDLAGYNDLASHGTVGRWREMTMKNTLVRWQDQDIPRTKLINHAPGWTTLQNLYLFNGTWFIVTDEPSKFPLIRLMTSTGVEIWNDEESIKSREPTDKDLKIIFPSEAKRTMGFQASKVEGLTWMINDPPQLLAHYYHFAAEALFGFWRTYSSLDKSITADGYTNLPTPRRLMFSHANSTGWRDYSAMSTFLSKSVFPSMAYEFENDFQDRAESGRAFLYDRVVFADRAAALRGPQCAVTWRTASEAFTLGGSPYWWSPVRRNLLEFIGGTSEAVLKPVDLETPVITYVSRQEWGRRMLRKEDNDVLEKELMRLHDEHGYEVNIVSMDLLTRDEQIRLAARTTIMLGVHGNGLTHLLWMKPTPRATVIEIFYPGGFAYDYQFTARALGITHYGFWGNNYFTAPDTPEIAYPNGFQGNDIPLDGKVVAELIHSRLSIQIETEPEGEVKEMVDSSADDGELVNSLTDETDPEFMNAEEE